MNEEDLDDDKDLFTREMAAVKPLKSSNKIPHNFKHRPDANHIIPVEHTPTINSSDNFSDFSREDCPEQLAYARSGVQKSLFKKLRSGKIPLENTLDLHGLTVAQARIALLEFIAECEETGCRCALLIHGKGHSSPDNKPIIKSCVNQWLRETPLVLAFSSALISDGGSGAVYVLLKRT